MTGRMVNTVPPVSPDPHGCLAAAHHMLSGTGGSGTFAVAGGWWPKACACLIRLALEAGIDAFWRRTNPPIAACGSRRAKLLMMRHHKNLQIALRASFAWAALSRATHHHCYELSPTAGELRHLHAEVCAILDEL